MKLVYGKFEYGRWVALELSDESLIVRQVKMSSRGLYILYMGNKYLLSDIEVGC